MGFVSPAAGKTGTSHDAWFAGFTSNLLCIVWVGNDDYTDIKIQGAHAAAPIWAAFMKRAVQLPQYSDTHDFTAPDGVQVVNIDKATNLLSDAACPDCFRCGISGWHRTHRSVRPSPGSSQHFSEDLRAR